MRIRTRGVDARIAGRRTGISLHRSQAPPLPALASARRRRRRGRRSRSVAGRRCSRHAGHRSVRRRPPRIARPRTCATTTARPGFRRGTDHAAHQEQRHQHLQPVHVCAVSRERSSPTMDRRTFLKRSGLVAGTGAFASQLPYARSSARPKPRRKARPTKTEVKRTVCTHCSVGCADRRHRRERRVDAAGAGVRLAAQPRRALRQGRVGARARPRRVPPEVADEARQRQVPEDQLGAGDQRGRRQAARAAQGSGPRRRVLGRQLEAQQRAGVPDAQVRVVLRHEQLRPPGAHLPLDHRRRRSQHLGLRRDDEFVQRHDEHQVRDVHRQQRRRSAPGVDAAHAACEGDRRQDDRRRSALHAHRGQGATSTCASAPAPTSRSCSGCSTTSSRTAGRTRQYIRRPRLRDGQGHGGSHDQVDPRQGRGGLRRAAKRRCTRSPR